MLRFPARGPGEGLRPAVRRRGPQRAVPRWPGRQARGSRASRGDDGACGGRRGALWARPKYADSLPGRPLPWLLLIASIGIFYWKYTEPGAYNRGKFTGGAARGILDGWNATQPAGGLASARLETPYCSQRATAARSAQGDRHNMRPRSRHWGTEAGQGGQWTIPAESVHTAADRSPMEELGLSVRARNALRAVGCNTIEDVLRLDASTPVRGLGRKTREEVREKLRQAGFPVVTAEDPPAAEMRALERSLDLLERRIGAALMAVKREARHLRQKLRSKADSEGGGGVADGNG